MISRGQKRWAAEAAHESIHRETPRWKNGKLVFSIAAGVFASGTWFFIYSVPFKLWRRREGAAIAKMLNGGNQIHQNRRAKTDDDAGRAVHARMSCSTIVIIVVRHAARQPG